MAISNGVLVPFVVFLVSTSVFSPARVVFGEQSGLNRPDPLRHLKSYNGGYDITNKHYWASTAFTGVHGYVIAGVWLLCGLVFTICIAFLKKPSIRSTSPIKHFLDRNFILMFILLLLFTILAIVASSLVLVENERSMKRTEKVKGALMGVAQNARQTIRKVTTAMGNMQYLLLPYDPALASSLNVTSRQLGKDSQAIQRFVDKNGHTIERIIQTPYVAHIVVVAVNLVLLVAATVLLLLHWYPGLVIVIFLCWILTTLIWVLTGFDFFLQNFAKDTCSAFEGFEHNSHNSSLSSILPCLDAKRSEKLMGQIGYTIHSFINKLNSKVTEIAKTLGVNEENDDSVGFLRICNPFSGPPNYAYVPQSCSNSGIPVGKLPEQRPHLVPSQHRQPSDPISSENKDPDFVFLSSLWIFLGFPLCSSSNRATISLAKPRNFSTNSSSRCFQHYLGENKKEEKMRIRNKYRKPTTFRCNAGSRCSTSAVVWSFVGCLLMFHLYTLVRQKDRLGGAIQFRASHHPLFQELEQVEEENIQLPPPRKRSPRAEKRKPRRPTTLIDEFLDENSQIRHVFFPQKLDIDPMKDTGNDSYYYYPGRIWLDTDGYPIQAHGGGILFNEKSRTYYWYGEYKDGPTYHAHKKGAARVIDLPSSELS
ncbi:unnamed protein product [Malus baccata var. baccata]